MIYFDNSATTFPKPECVYQALDYANRNLAFNAGRGTYRNANLALEEITKARDAVASIINCDQRDVTFFSSATEALNIIINGLDIKEGDNVYISPFEHNAIIRPLYNLKEKIDFNILVLPFDPTTWKPDLEKINDMFVISSPKAIFMSHVSNVTGYILPYKEIFFLSKKFYSINVLDAAQSFGVLNPSKDNVDFIVFAGHKSLYASFGIAGFINLHDYRLAITKSGGNGSDSLNHHMPDSHYSRYESGSPNVVAAYALKTSVQWLKENIINEEEKKLTDYLIKELFLLNNVILYLPVNHNDIFGIVSINVKGYKPDDVALILSEEFDICVRSGYHCSPLVHSFIHSDEYGGTIRISLGAFNTKEEIDELIAALKTL